jgi:hypothetical protein
LSKASSPKASFILLALLGKKVGFEKIIKLIDDLVVTLKKEQDDDDAQKEWCNKEEGGEDPIHLWVAQFRSWLCCSNR